MLCLLPIPCQQEQGNTSQSDPQRKGLPALTSLLRFTLSVNPQLLQYYIKHTSLGGGRKLKWQGL